MKHLKQLRLEKQMTQLSLQINTGIDQALLSKYETGERVPTVETLIVLAEFFNTNLDYLLDRTPVRDALPSQ